MNTSSTLLRDIVNGRLRVDRKFNRSKPGRSTLESQAERLGLHLSEAGRQARYEAASNNEPLPPAGSFLTVDTRTRFVATGPSPK